MSLHYFRSLIHFSFIFLWFLRYKCLFFMIFTPFYPSSMQSEPVIRSRPPSPSLPSTPPHFPSRCLKSLFFLGELCYVDYSFTPTWFNRCLVEGRVPYTKKLKRIPRWAPHEALVLNIPILFFKSRSFIIYVSILIIISLNFVVVGGMGCGGELRPRPNSSSDARRRSST